jgi:hypothetical protein
LQGTAALMYIAYRWDIGFLIGSMVVTPPLYPLSSSAVVSTTPSLTVVAEGPADSAAVTTAPRRPTVPWGGRVGRILLAM